MPNICNVNVLIQDAPADLRHTFFNSLYMYISFFSGPEFEKTGLENLKQSLYLCIFWI